MTRAEDALAEALAVTRDPAGPEDPRAIIAALPPDVAIVSVSEVAERLCPACWPDLADGVKVQYLAEARRLLGLDES